MVKIYSWNDISNGQIATRENLLLARKQALEILKRMYERGWIESGCIYGSVVRGDFMIGSDIDVLVISKPEKQQAVERYLRQVYAVAMDTLHVEPEVLHITAKEAQSGNHSITPTFFKNIQAGLGGNMWVGRNPTEIIRIPKNPSPETERALILDLIKKARVRQNRLFYLARKRTPEYYQELGHSIGQTIRSARIALDIAISGEKGEKLPLRRAAVFRQYKKQFPQNAEAIRALRAAQQALSSYRQALEKALEAVRGRNKAKIESARAGFESALQGLQSASTSHIRMLEANLNQLEPIANRRPRLPRQRTKNRKAAMVQTSVRRP